MANNLNIDSERKARAREIIEQLHALDSSKKPGGGVHGQVVGCEPYIIRTSGFGLQCLYDAQVLLDELLDPFDRRAPLPPPGEAGELAKLRAGQLKEPESGDGWRVEWWNENMRLMLPDSRALSRVQAYQNGTTVMTFKDRAALPHSMGKGAST